MRTLLLLAMLALPVLGGCVIHEHDHYGYHDRDDWRHHHAGYYDHRDHRGYGWYGYER